MATGVLITGGAGFLGLALARRMATGRQVRLLDAMVHGALQRRAVAASGLDCRAGDLRDPACLLPALEGVSDIVHLASLAGVERVRREPVETIETILLGTSALLAACRNRPIRRLIFVSTSEVYGAEAADAREECASANFDPTEARWCYGAAKLAAEHLVLAHGRQHGRQVTVVRPFNVYGPGQFGQGAVHALVRQALAGGPLRVFNGGRQVRAWLYVDDFVEGILRVLSAEAAAGLVFNLGNENAALSVMDLARRVASLAGGLDIVGEVRPGAEVGLRVPNMERARRLLGFAPRVDLDEGLERTLAWYAAQRTGRERRDARVSG